MNKTTVIETQNLTRIFQMGEETIRAVDNINMSINKEDFIAILGPSGSGKSTLLNIISGLDLPTSGSVVFEGKDLSQLSEKELDKFRLYKIGFVFQNFNLMPVLSALENVMLPMELAGRPKKYREKRAIQLLSYLNLKKRLKHKPSQLSAGEQQRVSIARALAMDPSVILADEPTGNLDSKTSIEIIQLMRDLNIKEKKTFIIATHDANITQFSSRVFHIIDGGLSETKINEN